MEKKQWWGEKVLLRFEHSRCAENIRMYIIFLSKDKWDNSLGKCCLYFFDIQAKKQTCQLHFQIFLVQYQTSYEFSLLLLTSSVFTLFFSNSYQFVLHIHLGFHQKHLFYETLLDFSQRSF